MAQKAFTVQTLAAQDDAMQCSDECPIKWCQVAGSLWGTLVPWYSWTMRLKIQQNYTRMRKVLERYPERPKDHAQRLD